MTSPVLICEIPRLLTLLSCPDNETALLADFEPDGIPALIALHEPFAGYEVSSAFAAGLATLQSVSAAARGHSLLTGRVAPGQAVPHDLPPGVVLIPWCEDEEYAHWLHFVCGDLTAPLLPQFFFPATTDPALQDALAGWTAFYQDLDGEALRGLSREVLAKQLYLSLSSMRRLCMRLFGVEAGLLLRVMRTFYITAWCMQQEEVCKQARIRRSPLPATPGDFRRSLQRLQGIGYSELRCKSEEEHWVAVWGRSMAASKKGSLL